MVRLNGRAPATGHLPPAVQYAELHCHSAYSLLDGASTPERLVECAAALGLSALALTDHDDVGGAVKFATAAHEAHLPGIQGAELTVEMPDGLRTQLVCLAESREGWGNLCMLVTRARLDHPRGEPRVTLDQVATRARGLFALTGSTRGWVPQLLMPHPRRLGPAADTVRDAKEAAGRLAEIFGGRLAIECWDHSLPEERALVRQLLPLAKSLGLPWVVANDVHYATPRGRIAHDVLTALRHGATLDEMGTRLRPNEEWHLKGALQVAKRWQGHEEGLAASVAIAERCAFRLESLKPTLPCIPLPPGVTEDEYLALLVEQGAQERWGWRRTARHDKQVADELQLIAEKKLARFFLIVWDIVRFARREGILCQGRGSAANSAVCYCLDVTPIDPIKHQLLFARFLSTERDEAPDIDIDFAHRERERVLQYVYAKYGREHAAMVCEQITWRGRSAMRDAARVLGFSSEQVDALASFSDRRSARSTAAALRAGTEGPAMKTGDLPASPEESKALVEILMPRTKARAPGDAPEQGLRKAVHIESPMLAGLATPESEGADTLLQRAGLDSRDLRVRKLAEIVDGLEGAPRHRGIHVGGFVLSEEPLGTVVAIEPASMEDRTVIQWEKDDLEPVGLAKIDLLGLGMLTVLQDCLMFIRVSRGESLDLASIPDDDAAVYDDLCRADTVGVFQLESRAQMSTLPRMQPRCFYDLVIEVALIRPGPIQGGMVHPYLRRRNKDEPITYLHPSLESVLGRTLGIPLFQEQSMQVAITAAGFTPGEADLLRKAMSHKRSHELMERLREKMFTGMKKNGISDDAARGIFNQIRGFASFGFPESHAASFGILVYASAYLRHHYAPEFLCAMLNAQPMGFYAPGTLIEDAKRHGVHVLPLDLTRSGWDSSLEPDPSAPKHAPPFVRLGIRLVAGLGSEAKARIEAAPRPFTSIADFVQRTKLSRRALRALAEAGAFDAFVADEPLARRRRVALWRVLEAEAEAPGPLALFPESCVPPGLPGFDPPQLTEADYRLTGLSLNGHPMRHVRALLAPNGVLTARELNRLKGGETVAYAGLVICRQRPETAKGFVFLTLEDETGTANVVITPQRFERQAVLISRTPLLLVRGVLQLENGVHNLRAKSFAPLRAGVGEDAVKGRNFH
jgi:error-prone DNA polymerase